MGYMFRLLSSHLQTLQECRSNQKGSQVHCGIPNAYIVVIVTVWNYYVSIGYPTVHLITLLIGSVFFEGLKMTR